MASSFVFFLAPTKGVLPWPSQTSFIRKIATRVGVLEGRTTRRRCESPFEQISGVLNRCPSEMEQPNKWLSSLIGGVSRRHFSASTNYRKRLRNPFWRRNGFYLWQRKRLKHMHLRQRKNRHIWPRYKDANEKQTYRKDQDATTTTGLIWKFSKHNLMLSMKRLSLYGRLIRGLHVQDALDWLASIPVVRVNPIFNLVSHARNECVSNFGADPSRLYLHGVEANKKPPVKYMKMFKPQAMGDSGVSFTCSWRNTLIIRLRERPLGELFHKLYILKEVPRSLSVDMRLSLHEHRVSKNAIRLWYPYLSAYTRHRHRKELKRLDASRQFDYHAERRQWIERYESTLLRRENELRTSRGLKPKDHLDVSEQLSYDSSS